MNSDRSKMMTKGELENLCWPISQLGEAMRAVARHLSPPERAGEIPKPPATLRLDQPVALNEWVEASAEFLGLEAEAVQSSYAEVGKLARSAGPALLHLPGGGILAVIKSGSRRATIKIGRAHV